MIAIEVTAAVDSVGTVQTFYLSDTDFVTSPTDTPAHIAFNNVLKEPGSIGMTMFTDNETTGSTGLELGEVVLANINGEFDHWREYGFDGRSIIIRKGEVGAAYPSGFAIIFNGTVQAIDVDVNICVIQIRDKQYVLNKPVLSNRYAGTNALPNGLEGTASDLKGQTKPRVFGKVYNIQPYFVNTSKLSFQVNDGAVHDIIMVYDNGVALTKGADFATGDLMNAASPAAGSFITCKAQGYFRLGSLPAGNITADVQSHGLNADMTAGQVLKQLAALAGVSIGATTLADIAALDADNASVVGVYVRQTDGFLNVMDSIANSVGAYYNFDGQGNLRMGRLEAPSGTAKAIIYDFDTFEDFDRRAARDNNLPVWQVILNHTKVWQVQTDYAGAVTADRRAFMGQEFRSVIAEDAAIKSKFLFATSLEVETLLVDAAAAQTEATRLLNLHKVRRDIFEFSVETDFVVQNELELGDEVELSISRFDLDEGKNFIVIGIRLELASGRVFLSLWG